MIRKIVKDVAYVKKLEIILWLVVVGYCIYSIYVEGWSQEISIITGAAIFVAMMRAWFHSAARKKLVERSKKK